MLRGFQHRTYLYFIGQACNDAAGRHGAQKAVKVTPAPPQAASLQVKRNARDREEIYLAGFNKRTRVGARFKNAEPARDAIDIQIAYKPQFQTVRQTDGQNHALEIPQGLSNENLCINFGFTRTIKKNRPGRPEFRKPGQPFPDAGISQIAILRGQGLSGPDKPLSGDLF